MRLKVSDGDLIILSLSGENVSRDFVDRLRERIQEWLDSRGLTECDTLVAAVDNKGGNAIGVTVLTVNDVFEDTVLK